MTAPDLQRSYSALGSPEVDDPSLRFVVTPRLKQRGTPPFGVIAGRSPAIS